MNQSQFQDYLIKDCNAQNAKQLKKKLSKGSANNRIYSHDKKDESPGFMLTYYTKPLIYANEPYYCPTGWRRYSLDVGLTKKQFQDKYSDWPVCYHGTSSQAAFSIILNGWKANHGCWISKEDKAVYVTPSIVYASHPRYSKIEKHSNMHLQLVLQLRVKKSLFVKKPGTLKNAYKDCKQSVDSNYSNQELEWVIKWNNQKLIQQKDGILIYGVMLKVSYQNPIKIKQNDWYTRQRFHDDDLDCFPAFLDR